MTPTPSVYGPRAVLINEVAWSGTLATAADEWIELHNPNSLCPVNLDEWSLVGVRAASVTQFSIPFENTDVIPAGGYFLIAAKDDIFSANAAIDKLADGPGLELLTLIDTGLILYLLGPSSEQVDTANFAAGVVNSWPAGGLSTGRYSMERYRNLPDTRTNWITYAGPTLSTSSTPKDRNGNVIRGTPGKVNWAFGVTITPSPVPTKGRTPTSPPPTPFAHMVINEFLPRAGTDWNRDGAINVFDEYIELKNLGPIDIDLKGWKLDDDPNLGSAAYTLPSLKLKPGERTVYYGSKTGILLEDSGDNVRLINLRGVVIDARTYGPVSYPDQTHCRIPDGYYWRRPCFPTPGIENSLTGEALVPAPTTTGRRAPCLLPDIVPAPFLQAECSPFGEEMWDRKYWDVLAGQSRFWVQDAFSKWKTIVE